MQMHVSTKILIQPMLMLGEEFRIFLESAILAFLLI